MRHAAAELARLVAERNHPDGRLILNNGMVCYIDPADFPIVGGFVWYHHPGGGGHYARTTTPSGQVLLHVMLMGDREGFIIDHKDRDGLNNRRENLRWATHANNAANAVHIPGLSGYRGVDRVKRSRRERWSASIAVNNKRRWLGAFDTREEAARAYDAAARELHGEFATLNFPATDSD